jgi:hypothetical protein
MKKIETCRRISALCVDVHGKIHVHLVILSIQLKIIKFVSTSLSLRLLFMAQVSQIGHWPPHL